MLHLSIETYFSKSVGIDGYIDANRLPCILHVTWMLSETNTRGRHSESSRSRMDIHFSFASSPPSCSVAPVVSCACVSATLPPRTTRGTALDAGTLPVSVHKMCRTTEKMNRVLTEVCLHKRIQCWAIKEPLEGAISTSRQVPLSM